MVRYRRGAAFLKRRRGAPRVARRTRRFGGLASITSFISVMPLARALLSLLVAAGAGAIVGIALILVHGRGMRLGLPFVPFMAFGAIVVLLFGQDLVNWYLRFSGLNG